ncbi:MAG TPA: glycosyltransferase [Candidatus Obscuribacterales bacterium]
MLTKLWIIAPCYYDIPSFLKLKERAQSVLRERFPDAKLITVLIDDSGGQDEELKKLSDADSMVVVSPPFNLGHQGALVFALRRLSRLIKESDFIVTLDSDGEDRPEDIPALLDPLLRAEDDLGQVSLAWRTRRHEGPLFKIMYFFFKIYFSTLTGTVVRSGNFIACRGWFAQHVLFHPFFDYCYSSSVLVLAKQKSLIPLARGTRIAGQSKMTTINLISHGFRMLLPFSEVIAVRAIVISAILFVATIILASYAIYLTMIDSPTAVRALTLTMSAVCILAVVVGTSAILFHNFNQTRALGMRQLTYNDTSLDCIICYGCKLEEL